MKEEDGQAKEKDGQVKQKCNNNNNNIFLKFFHNLFIKKQ